MMISAWFLTNTLSLTFIDLQMYLKQESISGHIGQLEHIILSRANQSLLILLNAAILAEKQQIPIS